MYYRITVIAILFFLSASAQAGLILMLDDGMGNVVTIVDGGAGDDSAQAGVVTFNGTLGDFFVNVSTGISTPLLGSALEPILDLNSVDVSSGAGTMMISLTATDFIGPIGATNFSLQFGGTTNGSVSIASYIDTTNAEWGTGTPLIELSGSGGGFSSNYTDRVNITDSPYSMSLFATITHSGSGMSVSSFDAYIKVPEPGTLGIFGMGLLILGLVKKGRSA